MRDTGGYTERAERKKKRRVRISVGRNTLNSLKKKILQNKPLHLVQNV